MKILPFGFKLRIPKLNCNFTTKLFFSPVVRTSNITTHYCIHMKIFYFCFLFKICCPKLKRLVSKTFKLKRLTVLQLVTLWCARSFMFDSQTEILFLHFFNMEMLWWKRENLTYSVVYHKSINSDLWVWSLNYMQMTLKFWICLKIKDIKITQVYLNVNF